LTSCASTATTPVKRRKRAQAAEPADSSDEEEHGDVAAAAAAAAAAVPSAQAIAKPRTNGSEKRKKQRLAAVESWAASSPSSPSPDAPTAAAAAGASSSAAAAAAAAASSFSSSSSSSAAAAAASAAAALGAGVVVSPVTGRPCRSRAPFERNGAYLAASLPPVTAQSVSRRSLRPAPSVAPMRYGGRAHAVHLFRCNLWFDFSALLVCLVARGLCTPYPPGGGLHARASAAMQWLEFYRSHEFAPTTRWRHEGAHVDYATRGYCYGTAFSREVIVAEGAPFLSVHGLATIALQDHVDEGERDMARIRECQAAFQHVLKAARAMER
jgi:hypothetical protein